MSKAMLEKKGGRNPGPAALSPPVGEGWDVLRQWPSRLHCLNLRGDFLKHCKTGRFLPHVGAFRRREQGGYNAPFTDLGL
jgi:hypothetical protein